MTESNTEIQTSDVSYILEHPWELTEKEWELQDINMLPLKLSDILKRLASTKIDGYSKIWRTSSTEPIAILGGYKIAYKKYETFFIASTHMEKYALKLSFDMRKILKEQALLYKGCTCGLYSTSDHPSQLSWFRLLGFRYVPEGDLGNTRYFEYKA